MNRLLGQPGETFPKKSSLFVPIGDRVESTWRYLSEKLPEADRQTMVNWQAGQNLDTMIFLTYARGGDCEINPFVETYGPTVDFPKVAKWMQRLEPGKHGANLIPCLFCDDDPETAQNVSFQNYYVPAACVSLSPYSRAICLGLEMTEQFSRASIERLITLSRNYTEKPLLMHAQWNADSQLPAGLDGLIYEHPWNPFDADNHSVQETLDIGAKVVAAAANQGVAVGFNEYHIKPWSEHGRKMTAALKTLPCFLIGGPG